MNIRFLTLSLLFLFAPHSPAQSTFELAGLRFQLPASWKKETPTSAMRQGQWSVTSPEAKGTAAEITAFHFGPQEGGDAESNINRWLRSLSNPDGTAVTGDVNTAIIKGVKVSRVVAYGTFASGMPGTSTVPKTGYGLMGAVIEGPNGKVFLKLTGPAALVRQQVPVFTKAIESVEKE